MHLTTTEGDLLHFLNDKVSENCVGFTVLAIDSELAAAGVLMESDQWTSVRLSHRVILFTHYVDRSRLDRVWVPEIGYIHNEFRVNIFE